MVLPRFVEAARRQQPLIVHDDGSQIRCFAHVADVIDAVVKLLETPAAHGKVFNIGSDTPISILSLAQGVRDIVNPSAEIRFQSYAEAYDDDFEDIRRRVPDLTRIRSTIGYQPRFGLTQIIQDVWQSQINSQNA
jgi:UDP-glucose 4-epimerase